METLLISVVTLLVTQAVKAIPSIPVSQGQTARIRTVAAVLAFLGSLGKAYADGQIEQFLSPELINVGVEAAVVWVCAHLGWKGLKMIKE